VSHVRVKPGMEHLRIMPKGYGTLTSPQVVLQLGSPTGARSTVGNTSSVANVCMKQTFDGALHMYRNVREVSHRQRVLTCRGVNLNTTTFDAGVSKSSMWTPALH
jgi:hypothetical protein